MSAPISANARAALDTIRKAEGTWAGGSQKGYGIMFGGGSFDWRKGHPDQVVRSGGYASAAAGAYQFMPGTWNAARQALGLKDFSPESQDRAAIWLASRRGVDLNKPLDAGALNKLAPEWASLPTTSGKSYYGQPVKGRGELLNFYNARLGAQPMAAPQPNPGNQAAPAAGGGGAAPAPLPALSDPGSQIAAAPSSPPVFDEGSSRQRLAQIAEISQQNSNFIDNLVAAPRRSFSPAASAGLYNERFAAAPETVDALAMMKGILGRAGVRAI